MELASPTVARQSGLDCADTVAALLDWRLCWVDWLQLDLDHIAIRRRDKPAGTPRHVPTLLAVRRLPDEVGHQHSVLTDRHAAIALRALGAVGSTFGRHSVALLLGTDAVSRSRTGDLNGSGDTMGLAS